jgi:hypothetical protein
MVFNATFNNISVISWRSVLLMLFRVQLTECTYVLTTCNLCISKNLYTNWIFNCIVLLFAGRPIRGTSIKWNGCVKQRWQWSADLVMRSNAKDQSSWITFWVIKCSCHSLYKSWSSWSSKCLERRNCKKLTDYRRGLGSLLCGLKNNEQEK